MATLNFPSPFNDKLAPFTDKYIGNLNAAALLAATLRIESSWGSNVKDRPEASYAPGGRNYDAALYIAYGVLATASIGPFQFMLPTAREFGFMGHPNELRNVDVALPLAVKLYQKRFAGKGTTPQQAYKAYNGGNINSTAVPLERQQRFANFYNLSLATVNSYLKQLKGESVAPTPTPVTPAPVTPTTYPNNILPFVPKKPITPVKKTISKAVIITGVLFAVGAVLYFAFREKQNA